MPERICELCGEAKTLRMIEVTTFGETARFVESNEYECLLCEQTSMEKDRDRWRAIAKELYTWLTPSYEDDDVNEACKSALAMYEQAVRDE